MSRMNEDHLSLEKLFSDLLSSEPQIPMKSREWITHYIDHGEYGLALENAVASFEKYDLAISASGRQILVELAENMKMPESLALIGALRALETNSTRTQNEPDE
jgi:hypothetical protein